MTPAQVQDRLVMEALEWGRRQGFEQALELLGLSSEGGIFDRDPEGCQCTLACEWPCFLRVGLTADACCVQCAPLEDPDA